MGAANIARDGAVAGARFWFTVPVETPPIVREDIEPTPLESVALAATSTTVAPNVPSFANQA